MGYECIPTGPIRLTHYAIELGATTHFYHVTNQTACNRGYFHGWIHECLKDGGGAICRYQPGGPVIAAITGPGRCDNNTGGQTCESGNFTSIH